MPRCLARHCRLDTSQNSALVRIAGVVDTVRYLFTALRIGVATIADLTKTDRCGRSWRDSWSKTYRIH